MPDRAQTLGNEEAQGIRIQSGLWRSLPLCVALLLAAGCGTPPPNQATNLEGAPPIVYPVRRRPPFVDQPGLLGRYYSDMESQTEHSVRIDTGIDFNFGDAPPTGSKPFSVSWIGYLEARARGTYTLSTVTDDGVRLWLNDRPGASRQAGARLLIDQWVPQSATEHRATVELKAGRYYPLRVDYFERSGDAEARLFWSGPGIEKQIIPASNLWCTSLTDRDLLPREAVVADTAAPGSDSGDETGAAPDPGSKFVDKTGELGIIWPNRPNPGPGLDSRHTAAWVDYDNDGYVDLCDGTLWRYDGGKGFVLLKPEQQIGPTAYEAGPGIFADFDNDGYLDRFGWRNHLKVAQVHRNISGTGEFKQLEFPKLPQALPGGFCWADLNGDGYVVLYVGGGGNGNETDAVAMNHSGKSFTVAPIGGNLYTRSVIACDYDEDNDMDVFATRYWFQPNALFQNDGAGNLTDVGGPAGVHGAGHTISGGWADFNNDGHFDLFACNFNHHDNRASQDSSLYQNLGPDGDWKFKRKFNFVARGYWQESYGSCAMADYDNDGDVDIFITTVYGGDRAQLFRNDGNWKFTNVTAAEGLGGIGAGGGQFQAAWGDYDNDGDVDLVTDGRLFQNQGNANHWLSVHLAGNGATVNRAAIGAQVRIDVPGRGTITRQVESGAANGSQNDLILHFGLGRDDADVQLNITWPEGSTQTVRTAVDRIVVVRQQ